MHRSASFSEYVVTPEIGNVDAERKVEKGINMAPKRFDSGSHFFDDGRSISSWSKTWPREAF
jgi:hypothetical protein